MVLSMENVSWEIFGDMCEYGHVGWWDMFGKKWNVLTPQWIIFGDGCNRSN
jgi:hypothetical protein